MPPLRIGATGPLVKRLQKRLESRGFSPGKADGVFGPGTEAAVIAFQRSEGLLADGVAGPKTLAAMDLDGADAAASVVECVTAAIVSRMFPYTPLGNIKKNLPPVLAALVEAGLDDRLMILMTLSTIRAETEGFEPVAEGRSRFNSSPAGHPFDLYDNRRDLGNQGPPDGERYRGRGYVQLTGRSNYERYGQRIGLQRTLLQNPDTACDPDVAAKLLAAFLKDKERSIKEALVAEDLRMARRLVNGGSHGLDRFTETYRVGQGLIA